MPDMLRDGLARLTRQLADHASTTVTYRRGAEAREVRAVLGQKLLRLETVDGGILLEWTDLDFCIPAEDMSLGGLAITPQRGDVISVPIPYRDDETYEVHAYGPEPPWRWADPHRSMVRVHTKLVGSEAFR